MARLRRANDGHLYIRASQSQGTWQVSEEGEFWLRLQGYSIPEQGEVVDISGGEFAYLKDHKYIYIHGFDYDHNRQAIPPDDQREPELVVSGLPLFLHLNEQQGLIWELALDLAKLNDDVWNELDRYHATFVTVTGAWTSVSQQQLSNTPCLLRIDPKSEPYQLYWENNEYTRQAMELSPPTPGLDRGWKGNVFVESDQREGIWRRCLPRSAISFNGKLLWLASSECKPEWPGKATPIGKEYLNWQLWRLEVDEHAPALWEEVWRWLHYRSIDLVEQRQRLKVVSPPMAVRDDGEYVTSPGNPLLIECNPPHRLVRGISKQIVLIAEQMDRAAQYTGRPSQVISAPLLSDQVNYFSWSPPYGGNYRIKIEGDAAAEPLLIQVASQGPAQPQWLHGLSCTAASAQAQQTFYAFNDNSDVEKEPRQLSQFTLQELPVLTWMFEPENLPISIIWAYKSLEGTWHTGRVNTIRSREDLTRCWREDIWPAIAADPGSKVTLDAGSFGCIELSLAIPQSQSAEAAWWMDARLSAQFIWLSRMIEANQGQGRVPIPVSLRTTLHQCYAQISTNPSLSSSLERLATANDIPAWIFFRLQALILKVEDTNSPKLLQGL